MMRTELNAAISGRGLSDPGTASLVEVLGPTMVDYAPPELAAEMMPKLLSGEELWCQGFSEPGSGSDLASLSCRATPNLGPNGGDPETATTWTINGQKVWTSIADFSERCVLLTRTGTPESRHRGITAFFVDMDTPGITRRPIEMINGEAEFCEVFFDDVQVPADRICGGVNGGWAVAMSILPFERSSCFWAWVSYEQFKLQQAVEQAPDDDRAAEALGNGYLQWYALRARSRLTQLRMAAGEPLGAETSVDKVLVAMSEHAVYDTARKVLGGRLEIDDDPDGRGVAHRLALLAGVDDLRRHRRGATQHHRPPPARAGRRGLMDAADRELLQTTVHDALAAHAEANPTAADRRDARRPGPRRRRARRPRLVRDARGRTARRRLDRGARTGRHRHVREHPRRRVRGRARCRTPRRPRRRAPRLPRHRVPRARVRWRRRRHRHQPARRAPPSCSSSAQATTRGRARPGRRGHGHARRRHRATLGRHQGGDRRPWPGPTSRSHPARGTRRSPPAGARSATRSSAPTAR